MSSERTKVIGSSVGPDLIKHPQLHPLCWLGNLKGTRKPLIFLCGLELSCSVTTSLPEPPHANTRFSNSDQRTREIVQQKVLYAAYLACS